MRYIRKNISKIGNTEREEIKRLIKNNFGLVFHEIEFNEIVSNVFKTKLSYFIVYNDRFKIIGCCPLHTLKTKYLNTTYSNPTIFEVPYGGWVFDRKYIQIKQLLEKTKLSLNESLVYWSNIQLENNEYKDLKLKKKFRNFYNKSEFHTAIIDLHQTENEIIYNSISKNTRHNIRRANKKGVTIEELCPENINIFISLVNTLREKLNLKKVRNGFYFELIRNFYKRGQIKILVSKYKNEYISAILNIGNKNVTHAWVAGRISNIKKNLYQNELLWWESIKWAKKNGSRYYDLCVIEKERLPNIARFKLGFSKNLVPFYYITKKTLAFKIINRIEKWF